MGPNNIFRKIQGGRRIISLFLEGVGNKQIRESHILGLATAELISQQHIYTVGISFTKE